MKVHSLLAALLFALSLHAQNKDVPLDTLAQRYADAAIQENESLELELVEIILNQIERDSGRQASSYFLWEFRRMETISLHQNLNSDSIYQDILTRAENALGEAHSTVTFGLISLAQFHYQMSRSEQYMRYAQRLIDIHERYGQTPASDLASAYYFIGEGKIKMGDTIGALDAFDEAIRLIKKVDGKFNKKTLTIFYEGRAFAYYQVKRYGEAAREMELGHQVAREIGDTLTVNYGTRLFNTARILIRIPDYERAIAYFRESVDNAAHSVGKEHPYYAIRLAGLSDALGLNRQFSEAIPKAERALELLVASFGPDHGYVRTQKNNLTRLYRSAGKFSLARQYAHYDLQNAKTNYDEVSKTRRNAHYELARIHEGLGQADSAVYHWQRTVDVTRQLWQQQFYRLNEENQRALYSNVTRVKNDLVSFLARNPNSPEITEMIVDLSIFGKTQLLANQQHLREQFQQHPDSELRNRFDTLVQYRAQLAEQYALPAAQRSAEFETLRRTTERYEDRLFARPEMPPRPDRTIDWQMVQRELDAGSALVEFVRGSIYDLRMETPGDSVLYYAFVIRPDREGIITVPLFEANELAPLRATAKLYDPTTPNGLSQLVWNKIEPHLANVQHIYWTPDGDLHRCNLGAIPTSTGETVAERYRTYRLESTRALFTQQAELTDKFALFFGDIAYGGSNAATASNTTRAYRGYRENNWDPLLYSGREVNEAGELLRKMGFRTEILTREAASENQFKKITSGTPPRILHLATHGYFFPPPDRFDERQSGIEASEHPLIRSGLLLSGGNYGWRGQKIPNSNEDGILTAYEVAQTDLRGTELVVLSACETALGDILDGEGVYGLQRAFKLAGARYVLMSLWNVDDETTYEYMTTFYKNMEAGMPVPAAYRSTQQQMRERYSNPSRPRAWAGFILLE